MTCWERKLSLTILWYSAAPASTRQVTGRPARSISFCCRPELRTASAKKPTWPSRSTSQPDWMTDTTVKLAEFIPDYVVQDGEVYTRTNSVQNPAAHLIVTSQRTGKQVNFWLPPLEGFAQNAQSPYQFDVLDLKLGYFTGLEVSHEPGQWAVWTGVILMGIGLTVVFYLAHTRFWIVPVREANGKLTLWLGGTANRNREAFENRFRELAEKIQAELKSQSEAPAPSPTPVAFIA